MSFGSRIVRLGYEYIQAVAYELEVALAEPSWFEAYRKALRMQRLIRTHMGGIEKTISQRLTDEGKQAPSEFATWLAGNGYLHDTAQKLVESVHDRDGPAAQMHLSGITLVLAQGALEAVDAVSRVEALTGDLAQDLGNTLLQPDAKED